MVGCICTTFSFWPRGVISATDLFILIIIYYVCFGSRRRLISKLQMMSKSKSVNGIERVYVCVCARINFFIINYGNLAHDTKGGFKVL